MSSAERITRAFGGDWHGDHGAIPTPGHSAKDRGTTVRDGDDGDIFFYSFNGGDWRVLKDECRRRGLLSASARLPRPVPHCARRPMTEPQESQTVRQATAIWNKSLPIAGTPAETYLRRRGLICALPERLRFARLPYGRNGSLHPCLVAAVTDVRDQLTGIQRTFLNADGTAKAALPKPKLSLGRIRGGAIRLAPAAAELALCEGLEDALTLQQELGIGAWAAAGVDNLRALQLPSEVCSVIIGADGDSAGDAGARAAGARFAKQGLVTRIIRPLPGHKDFNDELRGIRQ
jgi:DNA primase